MLKCVTALKPCSLIIIPLNNETIPGLCQRPLFPEKVERAFTAQPVQDFM